MCTASIQLTSMDAVGIGLADLDGLSVADLKVLLCEKHAALQEQHTQLLSHREQLIAKDAQLRDYTVEIETLKLLIRKLRHMQFGRSSDCLLYTSPSPRDGLLS